MKDIKRKKNSPTAVIVSGKGKREGEDDSARPIIKHIPDKHCLATCITPKVS